MTGRRVSHLRRRLGPARAGAGGLLFFLLVFAAPLPVGAAQGQRDTTPALPDPTEGGG